MKQMNLAKICAQVHNHSNLISYKKVVVQMCPGKVYSCQNVQTIWKITKFLKTSVT